MGARTKAQRDDDRGMILAALADAPGPLRIDELLRDAWDITADYSPRESHMRTDLRALERAGQIVSGHHPPHAWALTYRLATDDDRDAKDDDAELARLYSGWEPADGGWNTARWDEAQ